MSKKLNIIEAMKMPIGTEFEAYGNEGYCEGKTIIKRAPEINCDSKQMYWLKKDKPVIIGDYSLSISFVIVQKPVSFMEVVNSNKKCRVEHSFIDNYSMCDNSLIKSMYKKEYMGLGLILEGLSKFYNSVCLKEIIKNGRWYIEESEDDSNE